MAWTESAGMSAESADFGVTNSGTMRQFSTIEPLAGRQTAYSLSKVEIGGQCSGWVQGAKLDRACAPHRPSTSVIIHNDR